MRSLVEGHESTVERWRNERPDDVRKLEEITEQHTQDPLYAPMKTQTDIEDEFYEEVWSRSGVKPPWWDRY
jgi:hypothetical protein